MASDNSTAMDWIADIFTKETDSPTKFLHESISAMSSESKQRRSLPPSGRIAKRKSKRTAATIVAADPANFRQMVQQVTGARFGGLNGEAQGAIGRMRQGSGPPTFDTSARLLDSSAASPAAAGIDSDSFCCFPTLESWWE